MAPFPGGGLYTAPASVPTPATFSVTVTSVVSKPAKKFKNQNYQGNQDAQEVLDTFEVLAIKVIAFGALVYLLMQTIHWAARA